MRAAYLEAGEHEANGYPNHLDWATSSLCLLLTVFWADGHQGTSVPDRSEAAGNGTERKNSHCERFRYWSGVTRRRSYLENWKRSHWYKEMFFSGFWSQTRTIKGLGTSKMENPWGRHDSPTLNTLAPGISGTGSSLNVMLFSSKNSRMPFSEISTPTTEWPWSANLRQTRRC